MLHFQAYIQVLKDYGVHLDWSFETYCLAAHYDNTRFQENIFASYPQLQKFGWEAIYEKKRMALLKLYEQGAIALMPGVEKFLSHLAKEGINRCVVTHSSIVLIDALKKKISQLQSIPHWITREDYTHPKPHPECYLHAIATYGKSKGRILGFEDTPRGLKALLQTPAEPIWVSPIHYPELKEFEKKGVKYFPSFNSIINSC
jgi:HAD superfamily hydrolase (TIGR01509 family)